MDAQPPETVPHRSGFAAILREALLLAVVGVCLALLANWISPRGLSLARNYFPEIKPVVSPATTNAAPARDVTNSTAPPQTESPEARIKASGLQVVDLNQVKQLLQDPGFTNGSIIVVDSRSDEDYQAGHIPGAYQLDYFHLEKYIAAVLPLCQTADKIVVYCAGGECDVSEMTAVTLRDSGVPAEKLFVYTGGMTEWETSGQPIETGARNSGQFRGANK